MTEQEFRFKDKTSEEYKRKLEIMKANHALFMRRSSDPEFGEDIDRKDAYIEAKKIDKEYFNLTGEHINHIEVIK